MLKYRTAYRFSQESWPIVDLLDFNHQIAKQKNKPQAADLSGQLGSHNYEKYKQTSYRLDYISHLKPTAEVRVLSELHPHFRQTDRLFSDNANLQRVRELESPQQHRNVVKEFEDKDIFPLDSMQNYKPTRLCDNLSSKQLILFNVPLSASESQIKQFVKSQIDQDVNVEIQCCSLNLNSSAILTFPVDAEQFKGQLHLSRMDGILQECKSREDSTEQDVWNRTLVIQNLDRTNTFQQVLHHVGKYGRVVNAIIPLEIENVDLPFEEDVLTSNTSPIKLEVLNVETGEVEVRFHPSEQEFMLAYKDSSEYYDPQLEETVRQFQDSMDQKEDALRLYRILTQKTVKCLRVPEHLKAQYRQLWIPQTNVEKSEKSQQNELYNKVYRNRGYCLCTFSSKLMAQRALHSINQEASFDLSLLPLPQLNSPTFKSEDNTHSNQEKYGGRFRVDNLYLTKLKALKAWDDIELYQVDLMYNLKQLELIKNQIAPVRDDMIDKANPKDNLDETNEQVRRDTMRHKVYAELNKTNEFTKYVEERNFSQSLNQFEQNVKTTESNELGRRFNLDYMGEEYDSIVTNLRDNAKLHTQREKEYAQDIVDKHQKRYIEDYDLKEAAKQQPMEVDPLLHFLRQRVIRNKTINETNKQSQLDGVIETLQLGEEIQNEYEETIGALREEFLESEDKKYLLEKKAKKRKGNNKSDADFSTLVPKTISPKAKHAQFVQELKKLMLGEYKLADSMTLVAVHPLNNQDPLTLSINTAKDTQGNQYLNNDIIQLIRQFDIPIGNEAIVEQQVKNRKQLIDLIPQEYLIKLKLLAKESLTQNLIRTNVNGIPTETYELSKDADADQIVKDLNQYVALSNEEFVAHHDPMTESQYIVKTEKPYYKYDLSLIANQQEDQIQTQLIEALKQSGYSQVQAQEMFNRLMKEDEIPVELLDIIDKLNSESPALSEIDMEQLCKETGMSRKEIEMYSQADLRNDTELMEQEFGVQAYLKSLQLQHGPETPESQIRDFDKGHVKIKDRKGKFIVPKITKY